MPVMCLRPSELHHVTTGILAQAERSWGGVVGVCQPVASVRADLKASCPTRPYEVVAGSNCLSGSINEAGEVVYIGGCLHSE